MTAAWKTTRPTAAAWDPLLGRPKRQLANRLRAAEQRLSELEQAFVANAMQHQELARRNLALEAELTQTTRRLLHLVAEHRARGRISICPPSKPWTQRPIQRLDLRPRYGKP